MTRGVLIFAHDSTVDYGSQAVVSAALAEQNLGVPVSLVADAQTITAVKSRFKQLPFDQIIEIERPTTDNRRQLNGETVDFINTNRSTALDVTPYDRTLVIDSDFLIFSDSLNQYWDDPRDFLIAPGMLDLVETRTDPKGYELHPHSIPMSWATTMMFTRSAETRILFDLVEYIKEEYEYFASLYQFPTARYRNDFAFSVACHILGGHGINPWHGELPVPLLIKDTDNIVDIRPTGEIVFLSRDVVTDSYALAHCCNQDVHVMNKQNILDNVDQLLELAND